MQPYSEGFFNSFEWKKPFWKLFCSWGLRKAHTVYYKWCLSPQMPVNDGQVYFKDSGPCMFLAVASLTQLLPLCKGKRWIFWKLVSLQWAHPWSWDTNVGLQKLIWQLLSNQANWLPLHSTLFGVNRPFGLSRQEKLCCILKCFKTK